MVKVTNNRLQVRGDIAWAHTDLLIIHQYSTELIKGIKQYLRTHPSLYKEDYIRLQEHSISLIYDNVDKTLSIDCGEIAPIIPLRDIHINTKTNKQPQWFKQKH